MDKRKLVEALSALAHNAYLPGLLSGRIYRGGLKSLCVPGLNCYSCPSALGACPIGAVQALMGNAKYGVSMYVAGFLLFTGIALGRLVCGWLCPFGLIQELLYKIPLRKITPPASIRRRLKFLKYLVLLVTVIILPAFLTDAFGLSTPFFCKYICPAGTLEGGIPLLILNEPLRAATGFLFAWKMGILALVILFSVLVFRPFCRWLCPLGAFYSLFNSVGFYAYRVDKGKCLRCEKCAGVCKMDVKPRETPNSPECVRCGDCVKACPAKAISGGWRIKPEAAPCADGKLKGGEAFPRPGK